MFSGILFGNTFSNGSRIKIPKRQLCSENLISLLLEDHWDCAYEVSKDIPVILFNKPWNEFYDSPRISRVYSWKEAVKEARKISGNSSPSSLS